MDNFCSILAKTSASVAHIFPWQPLHRTARSMLPLTYSLTCALIQKRNICSDGSHTEVAKTVVSISVVALSHPSTTAALSLPYYLSYHCTTTETRSKSVQQQLQQKMGKEKSLLLALILPCQMLKSPNNTGALCSSMTWLSHSATCSSLTRRGKDNRESC